MYIAEDCINNIQKSNSQLVSGNNCSGIYDIKRVHYPKEYTIQEKYENYNFAVLQLYDDLSDSCGYVGFKIAYKSANKKLITYRYMSDNQAAYFNLRQIIKYQKSEQNWEIESGLLVKEYGNKYSIMRLYKRSQEGGSSVLQQKIRNMINQWTCLTKINLNRWKKGIYENKYLNQYLKQINWINFLSIFLCQNNIGVQGCKFLSVSNLKHVTTITLGNNNIDVEGCIYLSLANWKSLQSIDLSRNKITAQGCKYLSQANWINLRKIYLSKNNIKAQGCKYLSQANWICLTSINLEDNRIGAEGCKYLKQANWTQLKKIYLNNNNISAQGYKYLTQNNWIYLIRINLQGNNIDAQGCKYLMHTIWMHLKTISLRYNNVKNLTYLLALQQLWPNCRIQKI